MTTKEAIKKIYNKHSWMFESSENENLTQADYDILFNDFNSLLTQSKEEARKEFVLEACKYFHRVGNLGTAIALSGYSQILDSLTKTEKL